MALVLNEEQRLLQDTARDFLQQSAPVAALRALRDSGDPLCHSPALWQEMCELGWAGITLPESYGGLEFGFVGLGAVLEQTGRNLTASPLLSTAVLGANVLLECASEGQKAQLLPRIAAGELTFAAAIEEGYHHQPLHCASTATAVDGGWQLQGHKQFVLDGGFADQLLVLARTAGGTADSEGLSLFLVPRDSDGLEIQQDRMLDSRNQVQISCNDLHLPGDAVVGEPGGIWPGLERSLDITRVALAAEMLGLVREVFERTVAYLKERRQFDRTIGSFQALQHRAAKIQAELELCQSVVYQALSAVDESPDQLPLLASLAKAQLNELALLATNEAVQMHGGIGVTDELEIGFFLKRARAAVQILGDTGFHRDRYATLNGY